MFNNVENIILIFISYLYVWYNKGFSTFLIASRVITFIALNTN